MKCNYFTLLCAVCALLGTQTTQAQSTYWGVGSSQTTQVQQAEFDGGLTGWSVVSLYDGNGAGGQARWDFGRQVNYDTLRAPSVQNGAARFDAYALAGQGVPAPYSGALVSPKMDLSAAAGQSVVVEFYSRIKTDATASVYLEVSKDDGVTWTDSFSIAGPNSMPTAGLNSIDISQALSGNLQDVRLRFVTEGIAYLALIDDVSVRQRAANQLSLRATVGYQADKPYGLHNAPYIQPSGRAITSRDYVRAEDMNLGATVVNQGTQDQVNATLRIRVDYTSENGTTTADVYRDSFTFDLKKDSIAFLYKEGTQTFLPAQDGRYTVHYEVLNATSTAVQAHNHMTYAFDVVYNGQSNVYVSPLPLAYYQTGQTVVKNFAVQENYYELAGNKEVARVLLPSNPAANWAMTCASLDLVASQTPFTGAEEFQISIYEWDDKNNDGLFALDTSNFFAFPSKETRLVGGGKVSPPADSTRSICGVEIVSYMNFKPLELASDKVYFMVISGRNLSAGQGIGLVQSDYDYAGNLHAQQLEGTQVPTWNSMMLDRNTSGAWSALTGNLIPSILPSMWPNPYGNLTFTCGTCASATPVATTSRRLLPDFARVFPNPTYSELHVELSAATTVRAYRIFDTTGRLMTEVAQTAYTGTFTLSTAELSTGMYFLQLLSEEGIQTIQFQVYR